MSFTESIKTCFLKYIDFDGRASRPEYWWFVLFRVIVGLVTGWIPILGWIVGLALLLPSLSVQVRRLHDMNRSAWWLLVLVPPVTVIGVIVLLIMSIFPGTVGPNRYGPDPLRAQPGMDGYGYSDPGHPYAPPPAGGYDAPPPYDATPPDSPSEPELGERRFCSQCGMQLQPEARFCTVCGAAV